MSEFSMRRITRFEVTFFVEDGVIKVKWRDGDNHYVVPCDWLLEIWERYKEQEHEKESKEKA